MGKAAWQNTALLWLLWSFNSVCGAGEAEVLTSQVAQATKTLNYEGTFIYAHEAHIDAMRIVHKAENGVEYERLLSLTGPAREVIRDGTRITCAFADDKAVMVEKRQPQDFIGLALSEPIEKVGEHYTFEMMPDGRIAERTTKVVLIRPKTPDRYSYQLWIDQRSNLLLKSTVLGSAGNVLEQVLFIEIEIGQPITEDKLRAELDGAGFTWHTNAESSSGAEDSSVTGLSVGWVPSGFTLKHSRTQQFAGERKPVEHVVYTDGLAMVSVFVEELMADVPPLQGYASMGAVNTFSRMNERYQITVVGEVPQATVRKIAASVVTR
jgi:sigma-E factor negative regulatory protein RseB